MFNFDKINEAIDKVENFATGLEKKAEAVQKYIEANKGAMADKAIEVAKGLDDRSERLIEAIQFNAFMMLSPLAIVPVIGPQGEPTGKNRYDDERHRALFIAMYANFEDTIAEMFPEEGEEGDDVPAASVSTAP